MPTGNNSKTKQLTKVVYKPDTQKSDEFIVVVNYDEYKRWKEGDTSIPLTEVVDSFSVFWSNQGSQGLLGKASHMQLDNTFGTHKDLDVVEQILRKGKEEKGEGFGTGTTATNVGKGSFTVDTRGGANTSGVP